ncbi:hypothetical protein GTA08_BOTSDO09380 [Neofusicoccum parvum]|nr:hypothetical protein GTA08_BOTSDO09380 [Neofusicoccum parvum]
MCAVIQLLTATTLLLAVQRGLTRATDTCYYPDGSVSDKDLPCSSSNGGAACCPQGWACMANGFCYLDYKDYISRYTCTDQSWTSGGCPNYCLDGTCYSDPHTSNAEANSSSNTG